MTRLRDYAVLIVIVVTIAIATMARLHGEIPHAMFHATYEGWQTISGGSCCNDNDCRGADAWRFGATGYQVRFDNAWHDVPPQAVRPYVSPDGNAHVCVWRGDILCFVPGSGA